MTIPRDVHQLITDSEAVPDGLGLSAAEALLELRGLMYVYPGPLVVRLVFTPDHPHQCVRYRVVRIRPGAEYRPDKALYGCSAPEGPSATGRSHI